MRRAIVNFPKDCDYDSFKHYADFHKISLSRALIELAQKSLDCWEDERIANIAVSRKESAKSDNYVESEAFWNDLNV